MKKQFLSIIATGLMLSGVSHVKAMAYHTSKQLNDGTFLALYKLDQANAANTTTSEIAFALCRTSGDAPVVVIAHESQPKTIVLIAKFKANQTDATNYFNGTYPKVDACLKNGNSFQATIIRSLQLSGMQVLNN